MYSRPYSAIKLPSSCCFSSPNILISMAILIKRTNACFLLFTILAALSFVSSTETKISYSDHCASTVPESPVKDPVSRDDFPHDGKINGFFTGGTGILKQTSSFDYHSQILHLTEKPGLFYLEGGVTFEGVGYERSYYFVGSFRRKTSYFQSRLSFQLSGFWLESAGKLCMVGSASTYSEEGKELSLAAVLKLSNFKSSTSFSSLIKGTLASLSDPKNEMEHFETVSLLLFPQINGKNSLVSDNFDVSPPFGSNTPPGLPLSSLSRNGVCGLRSLRYKYQMKYTNRCLSGKNCTPFGWSSKNLPSSLSLNRLQCSEDRKSILLLMQFQNSTTYSYGYKFNPNMTWVGEGRWDDKKNHLIIFACRLSGLEEESFSDVHVGDCSLKLSLQYPSILSISNYKYPVGQIWSNGSVREKTDQNFDMVRLEVEGFENFMSSRYGSALKYKYTKIDKVLKSCPEETPAGNGSSRYPNSYSSEMRFDLSVQISGKKGGLGYSDPLFVGDRFFSPFSISSGNPANKIKVSRLRKFNMSYTIRIYASDEMKIVNGFNSSNGVIIAEGVYDSETGRLCMIGCRDVAPQNQIPEEGSMDCASIVKFQFPEGNSKKSERYIKGSIESTRKTSDPLFFERMELISAAYDRIEAERSLWRMDVEVILALLSISLASVFLASQIFHVKKQPQVLPFISISMLAFITLGYMIPLVLTFEPFFSPKTHHQNFYQTPIGLEVEGIVRAVILVAFLLQCRLLQLSWSARSGTENRKEAWRAETAALVTTAVLHVGGIIFVTLLRESRKNNYGISADYQRSSSTRNLAAYWETMKCYRGLVLDGFLLPQILINMFGNWKGKFLCPTFYFGTTIVNILPHAYNIYRYHNYAENLRSTYIYASPEVEFFSAAWDIMIPLGNLVLALIIFLQQKFGGRFMLPQKFRASEAYEKIPNVVTEEGTRPKY